MDLRIAVVGVMGEQKEKLFVKLDRLLEQIASHMINGTGAGIRLITSRRFTGREWAEWNERHCHKVTCYEIKNESSFFANPSRTVKYDTLSRNLIGQEMCDSSDIILLVWNGKAEENKGATWEIMQLARDHGTPAIWISSVSDDLDEYCLWESYYTRYEQEYLLNKAVPLERDLPSPSTGGSNIYRSVWNRIRADYLKKHDAQNIVYKSDKDLLLDESMDFEYQNNDIRRAVIRKYKAFDDKAVRLSSQFQTALYQRSVLPFISTIFLAVGFYASDLLTVPVASLLSISEENANDITLIMTAVGFLIHAFLNLYVYRLSKDRRVMYCQENFIYDRYTAEFLRVYAHFRPYGISLNIRALCRNNSYLLGFLHFDDKETSEISEITEDGLREMLIHAHEMIEDQTEYQERSAKRYESIVKTLERCGRIMTYIGFGTVTARGILQFVLHTEIDPVFSALFSSALLNMLALIIPATAAHFNTKLYMNNFR